MKGKERGSGTIFENVQTLEQITTRLREWPRGQAVDLRTAVEWSLQGCAALFDSRRVALLYEDIDEPWVNLALRVDGGLSWRELDAGMWISLFDPPYAGVIVIGSRGNLRDLDGHTVDEPLLTSALVETGIADCLSFPLLGESVRGRVIVASTAEVDRPSTAIGALLATMTIEGVAAVIAARGEGVREERFRVARDLHDGLLQSFTGVVLQLENIHSLIEEDPEEARRRITAVQASIMSDQRELRSYVEELRPRRTRGEIAFYLSDRLEELKTRFRDQWQVAVTFEVGALEAHVAGAIGQETLRIVSEAITNSARHGNASEVHVVLGTQDGRIAIDVADNGTGFAFHGKRTLEEIRRDGVGPSMLAERVASLNGDLQIESSEAGARVHVSVPLGWTGQ